MHIVTVNDYLARRDFEWMGKVFNFGISLAVLQMNLRILKEKLCFDITYATNNELGFDYLRDNMKYELNEIVQSNLNFALLMKLTVS